MDWTQVLTIIGSNFALILGVLGINIGLIIWFRSETRSDYIHLDGMITAIQQEMKDFHTKLALQDANFKSEMLRIEEKYLKDRKSA